MAFNSQRRVESLKKALKNDKSSQKSLEQSIGTLNRALNKNIGTLKNGLENMIWTLNQALKKT